MKLTKQDVIEQGLNAEAQLKNPVFLRAIKRMKDAAMSDIIRNPPASLTSTAACAKLQVLDGFLTELQVIVNDGTMASR